MKKSSKERMRFEAQELMWEAMETISAGNLKRAETLCQKAIEIYPDCVDALIMLADLTADLTIDYVADLRTAVEAGRRDLGAKVFKELRGNFWGFTETRPFMRAMEQLALAFVGWGTPEALDEAIQIFEEMLELNPNDNQGVRDWLVSCYLACKRYDDASSIFDRYPDDWLATTAWAKVLLHHATKNEALASESLRQARECNPHVEPYLTGRKRRPRSRPGSYTPGDESEASYTTDILWAAWKAHPKTKAWLKNASAATD